MGSFLSADPVGGDLGDPQTLNRYAYVRNNPLNATDPSGMSCVSSTGGCDGGFDFDFGFDFGLGWGGGWTPPPAIPYVPPPNINSGPFNDPLANSASSGPLGCEIDGIPCDLSRQIMHFGLPGISITTGGPCDFGTCAAGNGLTAGAIALELGGGGICATSGLCEVLLSIGVSAEVIYLLNSTFYASKHDIEQANAAWREVKKICASAGKHLHDGHRERWHEAIHGLGLDFGGLVATGVEMFCPEAGGN
jgi:hypothetical protein